MSFPIIQILCFPYRLFRRNLVILSVSFSFILCNVLLLILLDMRFNSVKRDKLITELTFEQQYSDVKEAATSGISSATLSIMVEGKPKTILFRELSAVDGLYVYKQRPNVSDRDVHAVFEDVVKQLKPQLEKSFKEALTKGTNMIRASFLACEDEATKRCVRTPVVVWEETEKWRKLNTFNNNLFSRSFDSLVKSQVQTRGFNGYIVLHYTSPAPSQAEWIGDLVTRFRVYALLLVGFASLTYAVMLRKLLLPLKRVASGLDRMGKESIELIERPWAGIELGYNTLARDTMVMQFDRLLTSFIEEEIIPEESVDPAGPLVRKIPEFIVRKFPYHSAFFLYFDDIEQRLIVRGAGGAANHEFIGRYFDTSEAMLKDMFAQIKAILIEQDEKENFGFSLEIQPPYALSALICDKRYFGMLIIGLRAGHVMRDVDLRFVEAITRTSENAILKVAARRLVIDREKNEISINLSTNMGHDLTNIIATSKWDIETIRRAWNRGLITFNSEDEKKKKFFEDAIAGLLNNTRMLQEIVNIYRAFGFAKRPQYEWTSIPNLVEEVSRLYSVSTSHPVTIKRETAPNMPNYWVEPRLLQLAVFNLLSNSAQATMRRLEAEGRSKDSFEIEVAAFSENGDLRIAVRDNGSGFRDVDGNLMTGRDLDRIFRYGYTTRRDNVGGGLGLSWVETIVKDFHAGEIIPGNRPTGGAEMMMILPARGPEATKPVTEEAEA